MADEKQSQNNRDLIESSDGSRRQLLKIVLGSVAAYAVPVMASFSMGALGIGVAEARGSRRRGHGRRRSRGGPGGPFGSNMFPR